MGTEAAPPQSSRPAADTLKAHAATWGDELRAHEYQNRRARPFDAADEGPTLRVTNGMIKHQERVFDPILQRYRDPRVELDQRTREEDARTSHLNRAMDVQILREQPFNVVTNASRLEGVFDGEPTMAVKRAKPAKKKFVDTFVDYNILSNIPMSEHHWAKPGERPEPVKKCGAVREVAAFTQKDYNILTNRYLKDHEEKTQRDSALNLLECTAKYRHRNKFDPLTQTFNDAAEEERIATFQAAHEAEIVERAVAQVPPSYKHRPTAYYNVLSHEVANQDMLKWMDLAEDERREQYKNRYIIEHNYHLQDMKQDHVENERRLRRIKMNRFKEPIQRGYNILNNVGFHGRQGVAPFPPYPERQPSPWEMINTAGQAAPRVGASAPQLPTGQADPVTDPQAHTVALGSPREGRIKKMPPPPPLGGQTAPVQRPPSQGGSVRSAPASVRSGRSDRAGSLRAAAPAPQPGGAPPVPPLRMPGATGPAPKAPSIGGGSGAGSVYSKPKKA